MRISVAVSAAVLLMTSMTRAGQWEQLPPIPDKEGFAGSFAGVSHGALLVGGGANFPDKRQWEGGKKIWYDTVFVLEKPDGAWKTAGRLPRPLGYGVSVTHGERVICVGGSDSERFYADVFRLEWKEGKLHTTSLPALPLPIANSCGALVGDYLYIAGGQEQPDATSTLKKFFRINLAAKDPVWQELDPWPGRARMLSVPAGFDGAFWLVSGTDVVPGKDGKAERRYLNDAYRYDPGKGWKQIADLPCPMVAPPSPAPTDASGFYILGGDDGTQVKTAPDQHRGFRKTIFRFDAKTAKWLEDGKLPASPATVPCVRWGDRWVIPGGEARPGVRTPQVWSWSGNNKE